MCTYQTTHVDLQGAGKGAEGWFPVTEATVYFDPPVAARAEHTLNVDFLNRSRGASARVAVELEASSAYALARAILDQLAAAPAGLVGELESR